MFPESVLPVPSTLANVICVDDNDWIGESIARVLRRRPEFVWAGWYPSAEGLVERVRELPSPVIILDVDVPGQDSFEVIGELATHAPAAKVIMLSGHLRVDLIDRALAAGAWGYVSKNDGTDSILTAIEQVTRGEVALSLAVIEEYRRR